MLILRRNAGECVIIDTVVRIVILAIEGGRVKLGIEAPADVPIVRAELVKGPEEHLLEEKENGSNV